MSPEAAAPGSKAVECEGRIYSVKDLDPGDMLDLFEAADGRNKSWVGYASRICSVRAIDGVPVPFPKNPDEVKALARKIGTAGVDAIFEAMANEDAAGLKAETAKN
jgi:hypothetical protein